MRFAVFSVLSLALHVGVVAAIVVKPVEEPPPQRESETATMAGETFELADEGEAHDLGDVEPAESTPPPAPQGESDSLAAAAPVRPAKSRKASRKNAGSPEPAGAPASVYGAVGERGSVDLLAAFTHAFPQTVSADPVWQKVPFGPAGEADVTITLDEHGQIVSTTISQGVAPAVRQAIARVIALVRGRQLTSTGPRTRLHVSITVSPDAVHDGLHGDVFAVGQDIARRTAFFALSSGRRIDAKIIAR